ncbi:MAG: DUF58 domain-containing protein [Elusimicrobia bacterium]|nr:DUF58 domain-containing protein [Elusimicrobiota bacterium]
MRTLVQRENESFWDALVEKMSQDPRNQSTQARCQYAVSLLGQDLTDKNYFRLLGFLRQKNPDLQLIAGKTLKSALENPKNKDRVLTLLASSADQFKTDLDLAPWHFFFLFNHLATQDTLPSNEEKQVQDVADNLLQFDSYSSYTNTAPEQIKNAFEKRAEALSSFNEFVSQQDSSQIQKPFIRDLISHVVRTSMEQTLSHGSSLFGSNHVDPLLIQTGLKSPSLFSTNDSLDYIPQQGKFTLPAFTRYPFKYSSYAGGTYHDFYYPEQIQAASKIFFQMVDSGQNLEHKPLTDTQQAYLESSIPLLVGLEILSRTPGLPQSPQIIPLDQVNLLVRVVLKQGHEVFEGNTFSSDFLAKKGYAPAPGNGDWENGYYHAYSLTMLEGIVSEMRAMLRTGKFLARENSLLDDREKKYLRHAIPILKNLIVEGKKRGMPLKIVPKMPAKPSATTDARDDIPYEFEYGFAPILATPLLAQHLSGFSMGLIPQPILFFMVLTGLFLLGTWLFFRLGLHRPQSPKTSIPLPIQNRSRRMEIASSRLANAFLPGQMLSMFLGRLGTEHEDSVPYEPGDIRIDHRQTAKRGELYAKRFISEKDIPLILLVDVSRSGSAATQKFSKREVIEELAGTLALAAARQGIRVGAVLFTDQVERVIPPRGGVNQAHHLVQQISQFKPQHAGTRLAPAADLIHARFKNRSLVIPLSDFILESDASSLNTLSQRHILFPVVVQDPLDSQPIPSVGILSVTDAETGKTRTIDSSQAFFRQRQGTAVQERQKSLESLQNLSAIPPLHISTDEDASNLLVHHLIQQKRNKIRGQPYAK